MKLLILVCVLIHTINAVDWINGRGAKVPFVEVEAEHAHHNGQIIGNDRHYGVLSSEASQRRAVQLNAVGQYVEFTMPIQANSIVVRYSIPDSPDGKGRDAPIDLYVNNNKLKTLILTSRYSWFYGSYPFTNNPSQPNPHHFYDELRTMFDKTYPQGTKVKLQVTSTSQSPTFTIDLADFELVGPPIAKPANSLSVIDFHADPTGKTDSTAAIQAAVNAGSTQKKVVYIPQGTYLCYGHIIVDNVHLVGAGPWYSVLTGRHPTQRNIAVGVFGKQAQNGGSHNVVLKDFAIIGDIQEREDTHAVQAIGGALSDSVVDNIWMQHTKCGAWMDGPMNNLKIINCRIIDTNADGVNFHKGVTNSVVQNTFLRNNGDDALAIWAQDVPEVNNKFIQNTIGCVILANHIAIYGGKDIEVSDNLLYDTLSNGGGIHFGNRYPGVNGAQAVLGTHTVFRNTLLRTGNSDYNWNFGVGAIWFSGQNEEIKAIIHVKDCDIIDSSYAAIHYITGATHGVTFENVFINGTGTYALQLQTGGEAIFKNVTAINVQQSNPMYNCGGESFKITVEGQKTGWYTDKPYCGNWPQPKWPWNW
jgi:hypothetical protein